MARWLLMILTLKCSITRLVEGTAWRTLRRKNQDLRCRSMLMLTHKRSPRFWHPNTILTRTGFRCCRLHWRKTWRIKEQVTNLSLSRVPANIRVSTSLRIPTKKLNKSDSKTRWGTRWIHLRFKESTRTSFKKFSRAPSSEVSSPAQCQRLSTRD